MSVYVLYDKAGIHSGRALGKHLIGQLRGKTAVMRGRPEQLARLLRRGATFSHVVNVGWFREVDAAGAIILNAPGAIAASSNKRGARIRFGEAGIPAPTLWADPRGVGAEDLPVIARTTHHTKGRGLWLCESLADVRRAAAKGASHCLKFIPNTREFRAHVIAPGADLSAVGAGDYIVFKLSEKRPRPGVKANEVVKSHDNGWVFSYPENRRDPALPEIRDVARKAVAAFGLHWGAVDLMLSKDDGKIYVLEINSTPCLTDDQANTLQKYAGGIRSLIGLAPPLERKRPKKPPVRRPALQRREKPGKDKALRAFLQRHNF